MVDENLDTQLAGHLFNDLKTRFPNFGFLESSHDGMNWIEAYQLNPFQKFCKGGMVGQRIDIIRSFRNQFGINGDETIPMSGADM